MAVDLNTDAFNQAIVKECNYPNYKSARISSDTYDAIINGKHKSDKGKGYRAFINSIILFSLMKTLEDGCSHRPALLILGSPILTLKEKVRVDEIAEPGMRSSLFKYFIDSCGNNQIIIAENEIPDNTAINYQAAHMIEFTQAEKIGVYGFLKSIRISKNS